MSLSPKSGPYIAYNPKMLGGIGTQSANLNPDEGTSLFHRGSGLLDPRWQFTFSPGQRPGQNTFGFISNEYALINQVPSAASATNIAASQSPGAGAIVLVSVSGAGITTGVSINRPDTGALVTGLLAIDVAMSPFRMGDPINGSIVFWDPTKAVSRALQFVSGGNDSGITFTVNGFDLFGFPMSETRAGANIGTATFQKAFKYVQSITHTGSVATTLTIGTTDIIGTPLRTDFWGDLALVWNNNWVTAPGTGYVAANTTSPATASTGDVRGTVNVSATTPGSASDGVKRLQLFLSPPLGNMVSVNGLFGVTQNTALNNGS